MRWAVLAVLFVVAAVVPRVSWADDYYTALGKCDAASSGYASQGYVISKSCAPIIKGEQTVIELEIMWPGNGNKATFDYVYTGPIPPDANCHANEVVPAGTPYLTSEVTGEACRASDMCQMAFNVGGANSGGYSLTGAICSAHGSDFTSGATPDPADPPPPGKPPPETSNPDGSTTYCDQISGTCVTAAPGAGAPPPSTGDSGDHADNGSTDSSSTTTNGATSSTTTTTSTSTTTTTTTGSGTGTGGDGSGDSTSTGTTTGTSTSTTDTPASSSSTSSKCTTGVCDVGQADGIMGGMYEPSSDTPASVYSNFRAAVSASPLVSSVSGFFDASGISGGSCPTWQIPGNKYWGEAGFSFDFFCSPGMLALFALAGLLVLAVGAFSAFRIAIY